MKENYMYNYLPDTNIYLYQRKDMFRFNTDTHLLGNFFTCDASKSILDIGTNNGALLLYASTKGYKEAVGIDILKEACELADLNLKENALKNYSIINTPLQEYNRNNNELFDVVICNPPYFDTSGENGLNSINDNALIAKARHDMSLNLDDMFKHVARLIKDKGSFYLVHRSTRLVNIILSADKYGFGVVRLKHIFDENNEFSKVVLVEVKKSLNHNVFIERPYEIKR